MKLTSGRGMAVCVGCRSEVSFESDHRFRDDLSFREFQISGLCQKCQDEVFADEDLDDDEWAGV